MTPFSELLDRARQLSAGGTRRLLGITGPPGAGKSTLAAHLVQCLGPDVARLVPMDGFHFAGAELHRLGRADRKGAVDTFDAGGFVALLRRLREASEEHVYAPEFRRDIEEPVGSAIPVPRTVPLVVTEGNYLLVQTPPWGEIRRLLDEVWYLDLPDERRLPRLIARHEAYGKPPEVARRWSEGTDQRNTDLVRSTRHRADLVVDPG